MAIGYLRYAGLVQTLPIFLIELFTFYYTKVIGIFKYILVIRFFFSIHLMKTFCPSLWLPLFTFLKVSSDKLQNKVWEVLENSEWPLRQHGGAHILSESDDSGLKAKQAF